MLRWRGNHSICYKTPLSVWLQVCCVVCDMFDIPLRVKHECAMCMWCVCVSMCVRCVYISVSMLSNHFAIYTSQIIMLCTLNLYTVCMHAKSLQSCPILCDPIDYSQPGILSIGFSRQEYWNGLPCPPPRDPPDPGNDPGRFFITRATWEDPNLYSAICQL